MEKVIHKHVMAETVKQKIPLYDVKSIDGKKNELLVGHDTFIFKQCECGFKEPIRVERNRR